MRHLNAEEFEALVAKALETLPQWVRERMENVSVATAPWPTPHQLASVKGPPNRLLLGLYEGIPLTRRSRRYHLVPPDRITLFQRPLEMTAPTRDALRQLIRKTIVHEVGHHFGLSEAQLRELD